MADGAWHRVAFAHKPLSQFCVGMPLAISDAGYCIMKAHENSQMKARSRKKPLTFGDFVADVYQACGKRKASGIVRLAVAAHLVEFRAPGES